MRLVICRCCGELNELGVARCWSCGQGPQLACAFCGAPQAWSYPVDPDLYGWDLDPPAAEVRVCVACHLDVEGGGWNGIQLRSFTARQEAGPMTLEDEAVARADIRETLEAFRAARKGPPAPSPASSSSG
jgi:hypothetical protein